MLLTLFVATAAVAVAILIRRYYLSVRNYPPGPTPVPIFGNILQLRPTNLHLQFERLATIYGPVFTVFLPRPHIIITGFDEIKEALIKKADAFSGRSDLFPDTIFQTVENSGVIFSWGDNWRTQRRCALRIMRDFGMGRNLMEQQIARSIDEFLVQLKSIKNKDDVDMRWPLQLCIGNIIMEVLFGYHYAYNDCDNLKRYVNLIGDFITQLRSTPTVLFAQAYPWLKEIPLVGQWLSCQKLKDGAKKVTEFIIHEVDKQCAAFDEANQPETFVQAYFKAMCDGEDQHLNMDQLHNVAFDIWIAGMETTTSTLRWIMLLLVHNPDVQEKMLAELDEVVGHLHPVTMSHKPLLPYCNAALIEFQRLANILPFNVVHKTEIETELSGFRIPVGTLILPQITSVLSSSKHFEEPGECRPERFLADDGKTTNKDLLEFVIPFSMGRRQCMGEALARMELFLVLLNLLQNYRILPVDGDALPDPAPKWGAVLLPKSDRYRLVDRAG